MKCISRRMLRVFRGTGREAALRLAPFTRYEAILPHNARTGPHKPTGAAVAKLIKRARKQYSVTSFPKVCQGVSEASTGSRARPGVVQARIDHRSDQSLGLPDTRLKPWTPTGQHDQARGFDAAGSRCYGRSDDYGQPSGAFPLGGTGLPFLRGLSIFTVIDVTTTQIYTHVLQRGGSAVQSPVDALLGVGVRHAAA